MEDEEGPHALPEPDAPTGAAVLLGRCGRHPAQPLAGVCSSCLMERLSSVGSPAHPEIVELTPAAPRDAEGSSSGADQQGKLRKTLMLLFQMDDSHHSPSPSTDPPPESKNPPPSHPDPSASRGARWKGGAWLRSILPKRGARLRRAKDDEDPPRPSVEGSVAADPGAGAGGDGDATPPRVERRASFRRSCEWMVCRDPPSASAGRGEPPRHSWDGSMVGRALACSFACLDEPADGVTRVRHSNAEEPSSAGPAAESRNVARSADVGQSFRERSCGGDAGPEMSVSGVVRRRSNRWSRVWDRSITSPLKEFVRKGEHALDRSVSESRKETRRCANRETAADIVDGEVGRSGLVSGRASQNLTRSSQANGDAQSFRTNRLKSKEPKIGRSRSVHYTSPGNFDNGMLRFYLTPMRSNRTANRGRRRSSRLFSRGLFGFV